MQAAAKPTKRRYVRTGDQPILGAMLRLLRKNRGLTLAQLADLVGLSVAAIHHLESGYAKRTRHLEALAKALGVSAADLSPSGDRK